MPAPPHSILMGLAIWGFTEGVLAFRGPSPPPVPSPSKHLAVQQSGWEIKEGSQTQGGTRGDAKEQGGWQSEIPVVRDPRD